MRRVCLWAMAAVIAAYALLLAWTWVPANGGADQMVIYEVVPRKAEAGDPVENETRPRLRSRQPSLPHAFQ